MIRRSAFTLLEMLLATALSLVLLSALWALFGTYTRLFDKGQARVEQAQLVRSLMEQISTDLQSAIQDPIGGVPQPGQEQAPQRRFGLFGTSSELRMDVLQLTPLRANATPVGARGFPDSPGTVARVPELRTVRYRIAADRFAGPAEGDSASGLIREEMDFESPIAEDVGEPLADPDSFGESQLTSPDGEPGTLPAELPSPTSAVDDTSLRVPEVAAVTFRYFDGSNWTSAWNSIQRKSLPAAVEVQFELARVSEDGRTPTGVTDSSAWDDPATADWPDDESEASAPAVSGTGTSYRLVIDLPGSPEYRKGRAEPAAKKARPARAPVRRIAPPRWTPQKKTTSRSDQWIRTDSP